MSKVSFQLFLAVLPLVLPIWKGVPGCSGNRYDLGDYARELMLSKDSRGRIGIGETSRAKFNRTLREITVELNAAGIPRSQFTPNRILGAIERWVDLGLDRRASNWR